MAELVGGAFLSSFLSVLFDRMASRPVVDFISGKKNNNELLMRELKIKLLTANKLVDDAEEKQMTSPTVRKWLDDLKDAIYCVGELLDEINTEALRRRLEGDDNHSPAASSSTSRIMRSVFKSSSPSDEFHNSLESKISNILRVLDLILNEKDVLGLKEGSPDRPQERTRQTTSRFDEAGVFGREKDRETILEALRSDHPTGPRIGVLPIVGMGGIGKSTLAQLVYKDVKVDFGVQAWVWVGQEFDILQIAQTIYGRITDQTCGITDLDLLSEKLEAILTGKKFLFVLDDVWSEDYLHWNDLMAHFNRCGVHGSRIIVTTRLRRVASITGTLSAHYLLEISEDDSWLLFAKHAFTDASVITAHPYLEVIGRQIVKKCQGLPLAIKSLGGLLHSVLNPKQWENILKSDLWELSNNRVLPALWLSYHYLPLHLKRCFAYCAIFPKGYAFRSAKLILLWMAEDLLQPHEKEVLEDVGSHYCDILLSRSFFQHSVNEYGQSCFTMHDLINDLAKFVSGEFCLRLEDDHRTVNRNICRTRHVSFMGFADQSIQNFEALYEAKHLHTFLQLRSASPSVSFNASHKLMLRNELVDLLPVLRCLRVLSLSKSSIVELPSSIGNLKQLRHLDVSYTSLRELPETVCTLYNLQTILLSCCFQLTQLPTELGKLINLRHLSIRRTNVKKMPPGMCNLKNLQTLSDFVVDKQTGQRTGELKELQHLRKRLAISGVGNIHHEGNGLEADIMKNKEYLDQLVLRWGRGDAYFLRWGRGEDNDTSDHGPENDREVLNNLRPHTNLKQLEIESYGGLRFPGWLGDPSFSKLFCIRLTDCKHCRLLPALGQLPSLKKLCIEGLKNVVEIGSEFYGTDTCGITPFRSLEQLSFRNMLECEKWSYYDGSIGNTTIMFPNLRRLELKLCPKLTEMLPLEKLPRLERVGLWALKSFNGSLSHVESTCPKFPSLSYLHIEGCPNFVCFPDGGMDAPQLEYLHINGCEKLRSLPEQMHTLLPSLQNLMVIGCPEVESFPQGGLASNIQDLSFQCCRKLAANRSLWGLTRLNSLRHLKIRFSEEGGEEMGCSFPEEGLLPATLTRLSIYNLPNLTTIQGKVLRQLTSLEVFTIHQCPELQGFPEEAPKSLKSLTIWECRNLGRLPREWLPKSLSGLKIQRCPLLEERFRRETGEDWPKIAHITNIDIECS
ncbi:putative disease resistance protein At3g14460 [Pyrus x bretschneideri]|uniref:putative disease resistance protein At3g14460 n=1 Tax=Pyrus x bretschneideri TaxID=225117 RepID=UPI00202F0A4C|nr:putative disease resistance protein At3g14460 [Pyrus x bretschneideri]